MKNKTPQDFEKDFRPMCIRFIKETQTGLKYETQDQEVELEIPEEDKKIASDFLFLCNGRDGLEKIAEELKVKVSKLAPLVKILTNHKIILDSRELFKSFQETESFPGPYFYDSGNPNIKILKKRNENKIFGNEILTSKKILKILSEMCASKDNLGALFLEDLYQLEFYVVLNYQLSGLKAGLYKFNPHKKELINLLKSSSAKLNNFLFSTDIAENSTATIFIVANHKFLNYIYPNRSYRYIFLRSGHLAQKAFQTAIKEKVCLVECCEFNDKAVSSFLNLDENQFCSTTLILGTENKKSKDPDYNSKLESTQEKVDRLTEFLTKKNFIRNIEVKSYHTNEYVMQKYATMATSFKHVNNSRTYTTCGVADTIVESKIKCLVEMYERYACSILRTDKEIVYKKQKNFFSITGYAPQNEKFLLNKKLKQINVGDKVKCVNSIGLHDNEKYLVPVDEVFYPVKQAMFYKANSSGVAAHYDKDLAIKNALYELIERDAVLVAWYAKKTPKILDNNFLSVDLKRRVDTLRNRKAKVFFLDATLDSCAVIICVIHQDNYPKTSVGCSANIEVNKAIEKSLDEAELMLNTWNEEADTNRVVEIQDIENTVDHGNIFARVNLKNSKYKWLLGGEKIKEVKPVIADFKELIKKFEPKLVDINKKRDEGIYVVRLMTEKLLPLTFGFGSEHYGHTRLKELDLSWGSEYPSPPHFIP